MNQHILSILKQTTRRLLRFPEIASCKFENQLRGLFIASLYERGRGAGLVCLVEDKHDDERLPKGQRRKLRDLALVPHSQMDQILAVGEFKFYSSKEKGLNYQNPIGARLSDLHYLQNSAIDDEVYTFFLDVSLQTKLVGRKCYDSLRELNVEIAGRVLGSGVSIKEAVKGKTYFETARDRTPRAHKRDSWGTYLFPCMDIDPLINGSKHHLRGPVLVRKPDGKTGLISIGVRHSHRSADKPNQITPYRPVPKIASAAVCFAVFGPQGNLEAATDDVV